MAARGRVPRSNRLDVMLDVGWENQSKTIPKLATGGYGFTEKENLRGGSQGVDRSSHENNEGALTSK